MYPFYDKTISTHSKKVCKGVLYALNRTLLLPFTLIYMLSHNIMPFIALVVPQSAARIPPAVKDTKTTDAENDTRNSKKERKKKTRRKS